MGSSIITLGAYGGLKDKYKYIGNHLDNFGYRNISRQEWLYMADDEAWVNYMEKHPDSKLTRNEFLKRRKQQRNRHPGKGHKRKKRHLDPTLSKRQSDLAYAAEKIAQQKKPSQSNIKKQTIKKPATNRKIQHRRLKNEQMLEKKRYAARFKEEVCSNPLFARKYYYQEKNVVHPGDMIEFKRLHTCNSSSLFKVALFKNGNVTIVCKGYYGGGCHARYHLSYEQILLLQYNAQNIPLKRLK